MPRLQPSGKDSLKKKNDNGKPSSSRKRKKIKLWSWKGLRKSRNKSKSKKGKDLKPSRESKSSSIRSNLGKLTDWRQDRNNRGKPKFYCRRWNSWKNNKKKKLRGRRKSNPKSTIKLSRAIRMPCWSLNRENKSKSKRRKRLLLI